MTKSKFLFIFLSSIISGLLVAVMVMAWTNPLGNPTSGGGVLYYSNGNVGIGTTDPETLLHIQSAETAGIKSALVLKNPMVTKVIGKGVSINFGTDASEAITTPNARITAITESASDNRTGFQFSTWNGTVFGERVRIDSQGNVGIGTASPGTNRLEVVGGPIKATGGLIIETRTSDPASPATGQMWLRTDI